MYLHPPSVQRLDYTMTWCAPTQTNGEVSPTSIKRLNPNALPFSPILKANVFTFSPVTLPDCAARTNGAAASTFPTSTTRLNPNALPFSPDQKTNDFSPVILHEAGATPTFPTSTARLNSNALPFWPRKAFTSGPTSPVPSFTSASESPKTNLAESDDSNSFEDLIAAEARNLILARPFCAVDLTNVVERLNKNPQASGAFASVHRCRLHIDARIRQATSCHQLPIALTCVDVAVKEIRPLNGDMLKNIKRLFREIRLWLRLKHENIVPLFGVADGFGSLPALISPWLKNGALTGYLEREHEILSYTRKFALLMDVARGLQYLHSQDIVHGDISGNNILVDENGKASLTDFGLSAFLPGRVSQALFPTNSGGTAHWMAPEHLIYDDEGHVSVFSPKSDAYSFGGIMLQVLEGKVPYHYIVRHVTIICCLSQGVTPKRPSKPVIIDSDWDFIQRCWSKDMDCRPSDADILTFVEGRVGESMMVDL